MKMHRQFLMSFATPLLALLFSSLTLVGCGSGSTATPVPGIISGAFTMTGSQSTPANSSTATGTGTISLDPSTLTITTSITYTGIPPSTTVIGTRPIGTAVFAAHVHAGAAGTALAANSIRYGFTISDTTKGAGTVTATNIVLTQAKFDEVYAELNASNLYMNVHSANFPDGEIRGQVVKR